MFTHSASVHTADTERLCFMVKYWITWGKNKRPSSSSDLLLAEHQTVHMRLIISSPVKVWAISCGGQSKRKKMNECEISFLTKTSKWGISTYFKVWTVNWERGKNTSTMSIFGLAYFAKASSRTYFSKHPVTPLSELWRITLTSAGKNVAWLLFSPLQVHAMIWNTIVLMLLIVWNSLFILWIQKIPLWPDKYYTYSIKS